MALKAKKTARTQGKAKEEALKEVQEEKTKRLNANLPESLYKRLKIKSIEEGISINDLVLKWVNEHLSK